MTSTQRSIIQPFLWRLRATLSTLSIMPPSSLYSGTHTEYSVELSPFRIKRNYCCFAKHSWNSQSLLGIVTITNRPDPPPSPEPSPCTSLLHI